MLFTFSTSQDATKVAHRALFLAYNASVVFGMGAFRAVENTTEEQVVNNILNRGDYPTIRTYSESTHIYADYVFGRMMKLHMDVVDNTIETQPIKLNQGFQSWSKKYKSYEKLIKAAMKELNIKEVQPV